MKLGRWFWLCRLPWTWARIVEAAQGHRPPALDFELRTLAGSERVNLGKRSPGPVVLLDAIALLP